MGEGEESRGAGGVTWLLENEGDIKTLKGENYAVDYCNQILEHNGSM